MATNNVNNPALVGRTDHPLQLRRQEIQLMQKVYATEAKLLVEADYPERDQKALRACIEMVDDPEASTRDKRTAVKLLEKVSSRLDHPHIELSRNNTERMKIKAQVATSAINTWQPNGAPPEPDSELQKLIDGAGSDQEGDVEDDRQ
ncbi:MAG: hypothetical protein O7D94_09445 [Planctomycetota bacterium]|nr:hypothetical protein [Planctomycetota bacterium]